MPVLPPREASTIARSVVGTRTSRHPLMYREAANAVRSQITPPPTPAMVPSRPIPCSRAPYENGVDALPLLGLLSRREAQGIRHAGGKPGVGVLVEHGHRRFGAGGRSAEHDLRGDAADDE